MPLLDTCTMFWLVEDRSRLSAPALRSLEDLSNDLYVSAISATEFVVNHRKRRVVLPMDPAVWFETACSRLGIVPLDITWRVAAAAAALPYVNGHKDPADRIIIATAMRDGLEIVTADVPISLYPGIKVVW